MEFVDENTIVQKILKRLNLLSVVKEKSHVMHAHMHGTL